MRGICVKLKDMVVKLGVLKYVISSMSQGTLSHHIALQRSRYQVKEHHTDFGENVILHFALINSVPTSSVVSSNYVIMS